jgi:hypothetical protein
MSIRKPTTKFLTKMVLEALKESHRLADITVSQLKKAGTNIIVTDTWAFLQWTIMSLLIHFPKEVPFNLATGNNERRPGVVFTHDATIGALAQSVRLGILS